MTVENVIEVANLSTDIGGKWILEGIDLTIHRGEIIAIVGGSGAGKSTLLRCMVMLQPFSTGEVVLLGHNITHLNARTKQDLQRHWGVLFQQGALFSSMTVAQNVEFPLRKHTRLNKNTIAELARLKIALTGLAPEAGIKYPSELSGGMQKRAALARALALDPELLFLDEPTAGLDPESANAFDELILNLRASLNLTIVIVTHDLDTLWQTADRVAFLAEGQLLAVDTMPNLVKSEHALIKRYFNGPRARLAQAQYE
ncbi:MAG: mkl [Gammaproteobacteria bacterium]|nr:mkl [Gammaproteobacteria bacterium]